MPNKDKNFVNRQFIKDRYKIGNDKAGFLLHLPKFPVLKIGGRYLIDLDKLIVLEEEAITKNKSLEEVLSA